jgi:hypothetical protein
MLHTPAQNVAEQTPPNGATILRYEGEDDQLLMVSDPAGTRFSLPKNRNVPKPFIDHPPKPLTPAFRLLVFAFVGLAPAGLGALLLAPLAMLWALAMLVIHPLSQGDRIRVAVVWGIGISLVGIAIPLCNLFMAHFIK